jgi:hypothetical protein
MFFAAPAPLPKDIKSPAQAARTGFRVIFLDQAKYATSDDFWVGNIAIS